MSALAPHRRALVDQLQASLYELFTELTDEWDPATDGDLPYFALLDIDCFDGRRRVTELVFVVRRGPVEYVA